MTMVIKRSDTGGSLTSNRLPKMTGSPTSDVITLDDSLIAESDSTVSIAGDLALTGRTLKRLITVTDAITLTPNANTTDICRQVNTRAIGTLTVNAPTGTPVDGQELEIRLKSTNVQTFAWDAVYRAGTTTALPTVSSGSGLADYAYFEYNADAVKWDLKNVQLGF